MFDSIYFEAKLPIPSPVDKLKINWKKEEFQTKDLDNLMHRYRVNRNGQLFLLDQKLKWVSDNSRFGGYMETISEKWRKSSYTGTVVFYTTICSNPEQKENDLLEFATEEKIAAADGFDYHLDFQGKFINGKLSEVKLLSVESYPIKEYLVVHNEWLTGLKEKESKISFKIKNFLKKKIPNRGYFKIINYLNRFLGFQQDLLRKLY